MSEERPNWHRYFMRIAHDASTRASCDRLRVGAVIARDRQVLTTGYNGSLPGAPHCDEVGHLMKDGHCVRTNHAERNAVLQAARRGIMIDGSTCYCVWKPCLECLKALLGAGVRRVVYEKVYGNPKSYFGEDELLAPFPAGTVMSIEEAESGPLAFH